jgi:hypothetical protein
MTTKPPSGTGLAANDSIEDSIEDILFEAKKPFASGLGTPTPPPILTTPPPVSAASTPTPPPSTKTPPPSAKTPPPAAASTATPPP